MSTRGNLDARFYFEFVWERGQKTDRATIHDRCGRYGGELMCNAVSAEIAQRVVDALNADERKRQAQRKVEADRKRRSANHAGR